MNKIKKDNIIEWSRLGPRAMFGEFMMDIAKKNENLILFMNNLEKLAQKLNISVEELKSRIDKNNKAEIDLISKGNDIWNLKFVYNLTTCADQDYEDFNKKFGINDELFHFKLNGEALIYNEEIRGGKNMTAQKDFYWRGKNPILFELEEYGTGIDKDSRFIQIVRFTIV